MKDKTQNKNIFQVNDQKNPTPLPFPERTFYVHDTFLLFFLFGVLLLLGFFFFNLFSGGVFLGKNF